MGELLLGKRKEGRTEYVSVCGPLVGGRDRLRGRCQDRSCGETARRRLVMDIIGIMLLVVVAAILGVGAQIVPGYAGPRTRFDGGIVALATEFIGNTLKHIGTP